MQFKEALKAAGLRNPGRTTWSGITPDGIAVFTIWEHEIHQVNGRWFAWWNHGAPKEGKGELTPSRKGHAKAFLQRATDNLGLQCRAVIVKPRFDSHGEVSAERAEYPHTAWGTVVFRITDMDALQFVAELLPAH